jgi:hypothetical protein
MNKYLQAILFHTNPDETDRIELEKKAEEENQKLKDAQLAELERKRIAEEGAQNAIQSTQGELSNKESAMAALARMKDQIDSGTFKDAYGTKDLTPLANNADQPQQTPPPGPINGPRAPVEQFGTSPMTGPGSQLQADEDAKSAAPQALNRFQNPAPYHNDQGLTEGQQAALNIIKGIAQKPNEQIYGDQELTGKYSDVPEVQNYLKSRSSIDENKSNNDATKSFQKDANDTVSHLEAIYGKDHPLVIAAGFAAKQDPKGFMDAMKNNISDIGKEQEVGKSKTANEMQLNTQKSNLNKSEENQKFNNQLTLLEKKGASVDLSPQDITPETPEYKIAEDLANNKINFDQMTKLYPGFSKTAGQRKAILEKAIEINPDYSPSNQMLGYGAMNASKSNAKLQDMKVGQAKDLQLLLDKYKDPTTGEYKNIPPQFVTELAMGAARLISPTGQVAQGITKELQQATAQEKIARTLGFFGIQSTGSTQQNLQNLRDMFERQGSMAQHIRDTYYSGKPENVTFEPLNKNIADNISVPSPKTQSEYDRLPSGTVYIDTDGSKKRKK